MNFFSKRFLNWIAFIGLSLFLVTIGEIAYQSLPKSFFSLAAQSLESARSQQQVLGIHDDQRFETAQVKKVVDGDTIELIDGRKVRYIGVDTPETKHPSKKQQCFGREASLKNKQLVEGKTVKLEKDVSETDRYGRLLRYVWVDDQLINLTLVQAGFAFARSYPPDVAKQDQFKNAEKTARETGAGLWSSCQLNPTGQINQVVGNANESLHQ